MARFCVRIYVDGELDDILYVDGELEDVPRRPRGVPRLPGYAG